MPEGILDLQNVVFPPGIDAGRIATWQNRSGVDFGELLRIIDGRLGAAGELVDPLVAAYSFPSTQQTINIGNALAFDVTERGEYARERGQRTTLQGAMLPIRDWENALHMTSQGLEEMTMDDILIQVDSAVTGHRRRERIRFLQRLFAIEEWQVDRRTAALSPSFAGSGVGVNLFASPYPDGVMPTLPYTLYSRTAVATLNATVVARMAELDRWFGGPGVYDLIGGTNAIAAVIADAANYVPAGSPLIIQASTTAQAQVDPDLFIGVYAQRCRVRPALTEVQDTAADFRLALVRTFGANDPRNPIVYRYDPTRPNPWVELTSLYPLADTNLFRRYDFGVSNPTGAGLMRFAAAGNYTTPTIV